MPQFPMKPLDTFQSKQLPNTILQPNPMQPDLAAADKLQTQTKHQPFSNWPITDLNIPNIQNVPVPNYPNHINEEVLPEKVNADAIADVPVADRKKDGKNIQSKTDSTSSDDSDYNDDDEETTTEPPKKKKKHRKLNKTDKSTEDNENKGNANDQLAHQMQMTHSDLRAEFMDHDGEADRPGGAVVSLAFGKKLLMSL